MALSPANRLSAKEVKSLLRRANIASDDVATIRFMRHQGSESRFAVVVSKKVASSSVKRNVLRRRTSGWFSRNMERMFQGFGVVIIYKPKASELTRNGLYFSLERLFKKTPLWS